MARADELSDRGPRAPVVQPGHTAGTVTDRVSERVLTQRFHLAWYIGFGIAFAAVLALLFVIAHLLFAGVGVWGINIPVAWGFAIINLVWWVGISHAGTLIAAILLLTRQPWRSSISRIAEAITLFAIASAVLFPLLHMGRPWLFYWMVPYPNTMGLLPQFISPLTWDFVAIFTYAAVAVLFWYVGLLPDLATLRDRSRRRWLKKIYAVLAMGWRGSATHWERYHAAYLLLAVLTPFIVTVHAVVGLAYATAVVPGWHSTLLPVNFIAGAIFSGFALLLAIIIPLRAIFNLHDLITARQLDNLAKILLALGLLVAYAYLMEAFTHWYSADPYQRAYLDNRFLGPYAPLTWLLLVVNVLLPQVLWFDRIRRNTILLFFIGLAITIGIWIDRFLVTTVSLSQDYLPSAWHAYSPRMEDWSLFVGSIGLFFALLFLYVRFLPLMSLYELQETTASEEEPGEGAPA